MKTGEISEQQAALEAAHIETVKDWSARIADWTVRSAALRKEREALENELSEDGARMTMHLVRFGYSLEAAQLRVEALLEQAFRKTPQ